MKNAVKKATDFGSIGDLIRDPSIVWYGPHECTDCGKIVVKSGAETGGVALDFAQDSHYPNHQWRLHQCQIATAQIKSTADLSIGKIIRIKSSSPHSHSLWRITGHMDGANQQENLVAIRRLELNPGNAKYAK